METKKSVRLATIHETAERCKAEDIPLSEFRLRKLTEAGLVPFIPFGNKKMIRWSDVVAFVEGVSANVKDR